MNSVERVRQLCKERKIPISRLEKELGYANGYINQLRKGVFPANRLMEIANYLSVPVDFLITGETKKTPAEGGGRMGDLDEFSFGFFETFNGLTEENQMKLKELAEMFKRDQEQRKREK